MSDPRIAKLRALRDGAGTPGERIAAERALERLSATSEVEFTDAEVREAVSEFDALMRDFAENLAESMRAVALAFNQFGATLGVAEEALSELGRRTEIQQVEQ